LSQLGYDAYGCDIERYYLHNYAKKANSSLTLCDAQKLPYNRSTFDIITSFELIEHLPNQIEFLKDCFECLKTKGTLVLQTPRGIPSIDAIFSKIRSRAIIKKTEVEHHVSTLINTSNLMRLLNHCGFTARIETWFLMPVKPTIFNKYFATRVPSAVPTFRAIAIKARSTKNAFQKAESARELSLLSLRRHRPS
jgi:2-polyprenyl-3-methyl-5-hydroxy-6-metoxy-1,4-benzoquinol methylase